jgi:hypothetical protein
MNPEKRIMICRLIEKVDAKGEYSKKLGIENVSTFHGKMISKVEVKIDDLRYDNFCYTGIYTMAGI